MKSNLIHATAAVAALAALAAPATHAEGFASGVHARAFAAAERGPEALRGFIHRTRMIHALRFADYGAALPEARELAAPDADANFPAPEESPAPAWQRQADDLREQILRDLAHE